MLRDDLLRVDYDLESTVRRLGEVALAALARNSTLAADRVLGRADDLQADAIRLWLLQQPVPRRRLREWASLAALEEAGLVSGRSNLRASVELKPHGSLRRNGWIVCDQTPMDQQVLPPRADFVLGASPASTTLSQLVPPKHVARALDLGTGCGVQALHLDADHIVATDLNPRALALAQLTLGLSGVSADLRAGDLYQPVVGERFDLILTNPPFVLSPPASPRLTYREAGLFGDELMRRVVVEGAAHLAEGGTLVVLGNWADVGEQPWTERLEEWIRPTGCDALVLRREDLDPYEYIEIWLTDAGLAGTPSYRSSYQRWLDYFDECDIRGVGMGWIVLRRAGRDRPEIRIEDWPHAVHQPVGWAIAEHFDSINASRLGEQEFLAAHWQLHPGVVQESVGLVGAGDPAHLVLRQQFGLGRGCEPGTAAVAVVGACDGELPVSRLIGAVGELLGVDASALTAELLPVLRRLVADGYLMGGPRESAG